MNAFTSMHRQFGGLQTWLLICKPGVMISNGLGFHFKTIASKAVVDDFGNLVAVGDWK